MEYDELLDSFDRPLKINDPQSDELSNTNVEEREDDNEEIVFWEGFSQKGRSLLLHKDYQYILEVPTKSSRSSERWRCAKKSPYCPARIEVKVEWNERDTVRYKIGKFTNAKHNHCAPKANATKRSVENENSHENTTEEDAGMFDEHDMLAEFISSSFQQKHHQANNEDVAREENTELVGFSSVNPRLGVVDFPYIVTTTDKGNTMLVTDSQTPGFRHHWSVHTRRPARSERFGNYTNERYACIKCKQQSRDTNVSKFAPCLSIVLFPNGEVLLKTHPWTGIRSHICPGIPEDESDACLLLRRKRQDIINLKIDPHNAYDELMREIAEMPSWSEDKKQRVRYYIGSRRRNDRTFNRCRVKGQRSTTTTTTTTGGIIPSTIAGDNCKGNGGGGVFADDDVVDVKNANKGLVSDLALFFANASNGVVFRDELRPSAASTSNSTDLVKNWIDKEMEKNGSWQEEIDAFSSTAPCGDNGARPACASTANNRRPNFSSFFLNSSTDPQSKVNLTINVSSGAQTPKRKFNFDSFPQRRIALMFLYCGWEHDGLVAQRDAPNTVEEHIFNALLKTHLIKNRESCQWTRCGRTDKGVSAFKQIAAVNVRSNDVNGENVFWPLDSDPACRIANTSEHNFTRILNGVLPRSIRVLGWSSTHRDFNARFNCAYRLYTYVFPRANVNIEALNNACERLIGAHDFRNFCHIDNNKNRLEMSYVREIFHAGVESLSSSEDNDKYSLLKLTVKASGFLWHQIRCIVAVLYEIGCGRETPQLISEMLDVERCPARPQYGLANETPLCLFDCSYPDGDLKWNFDVQILHGIVEDLQRMWADLQVKATMVKAMICGISPMLKDKAAIEEIDSVTSGLESFTTPTSQTKNYIRIMKRPKCQSLQERIEKYTKKIKQESSSSSSAVDNDIME